MTSNCHKSFLPGGIPPIVNKSRNKAITHVRNVRLIE